MNLYIDYKRRTTEMLTSDKAICEMNTGELAEEYESSTAK